MKWWFLEKATIAETTLSDSEVRERILTIARPKHRILDTLNPDHTFADDYKTYVGTIGENSFRVKRGYSTMGTRGRVSSVGLVVIGHIGGSHQNATLDLRFTVPAINLLWFLFPPLWMLVFVAYAADYGFLHGIPVFTLLVLLLLFYLYWMVLAQFRRHAKQALADFQQAMDGLGGQWQFS